MPVKIRKATVSDIDAINKIYENIHTAEESANAFVGWVRGVYPTKSTAQEALQRRDLFAEEYNGQIVGTAILNQIQPDIYRAAQWQYDADDKNIMVMHTLAIDPCVKGHGFGRAFEEFYEEYAISHGCEFLRIDTNERNKNARKFYKNAGYKEVAILPCDFNGIDNINLVMLEKRAQKGAV